MLSDRPGPLYTVDTVVVALSVSLLYLYMYIQAVYVHVYLVCFLYGLCYHIWCVLPHYIDL